MKDIYKKNLYKGKLILKEDILQQNCIATFKLVFGDFTLDKTKPMIIHIANETSKQTSIGYHVKMKKQGKVAGIPDLMIISNEKVFFVELKAENGQTSKQQNYLIECFEFHKIQCFVCKTEQEFLNICKKII